jgi:hypothetical protein
MLGTELSTKLDETTYIPLLPEPLGFTSRCRIETYSKLEYHFWLLRNSTMVSGLTMMLHAFNAWQNI